MDEKQALELISGGETETTEFKRTTTKDSGKTICAFSNAGGGVLFIGVEDKGSIKGLNPNSLDKIQQQIYHSQQECSPVPVCSISKVNTKFGVILAVKVPQFGSGVCYYKDEIYVRVGTTNHRIAGPAIEDFLKKKQVLCFEDENSDAKISDLDLNKIKSYVGQRNPSINFESSKIKSILRTLRVAIGNGDFHLKKSAVLLFAKNPDQFILQNQVKLARFKGVLAIDILDTITLSDTLIENIERSVKFVIKNISKSYKIEGVRRKEVLEYPIVALREAIVNAIVHRDYYSPAATQINIFDDRIEITNPGALPKELKVKDLPFLGLGIPRNPTLYRLLSDVKIVEGLGTGFPRMFGTMRAAGLPDPRPEDIGTLFKITLYNKFPSIGEKGLNERQQMALGYINEHKTITSSRYMELYSISKPTAVIDLKKLVKLGFLKRIGKAKATYYTVKSK